MPTYTGTSANDVFVGTSGDDIFDYGNVVYSGATITVANGFDTISAGSGGNDVLNLGNVSGDHLYGYRDGNDFVLLIQPDTNWNFATPADATTAAIGGVRIAGMATAGGMLERVNFADGYATFSLTTAGFSGQQTAGALLIQVFNSANVLQHTEQFGTAGDDQLRGTAGSDGLHGGDGSDVLRGLAGNDELFGDAGNDVLRGGGGDDRLDGGAGWDRVSFVYGENGITAGATVDLRIQDGTAQWTGYGWDTLLNIEHANGSDGSDALIGNDGDNYLWGGIGGSDTLTGNGGNDLLEVGGLSTISGVLFSLDGGAGSDTASFNSFGYDPNTFVGIVGVNVTLVTQGSAQTIATGYQALLSGIENLSGSDANDTLTGDGNANLLAGSMGNDTLFGGGGDDTLLGDGIVMTDSGGIGTSGPITTFNDVAALGGIDGSDTLYGQGGNDRLEGGGGNDFLYGGDGYDTLVGGAGNDLLDGGPGDPVTGDDFDIVRYDAAGSAVTVNLAAGTATSVTDGSDTLVEIEGVYGSNLGDTLTGDAVHNGLWGLGGNDSLSGGDGGDYLAGGAGNDTISGDGGDDELDGGTGTDYLDGGIGTDTLNFWDTTFVLSGGAVVDLQAGTSFYQGETDTLVSIENVQGTFNDADTLRGNALANKLEGLGGNDTLTGAGGNDTLDGGDGADTAVYSGLRANYQITSNPNGTLTITDLRAASPGFTPDGSDTVRNVESFQFADLTQTLAQLTNNLAPTVGGLSANETSLSFTANDVDNATLSLAAPFASAFGNPTIQTGVVTTLLPTAQASTPLSGTLAVQDAGGLSATVSNLWLGTNGNDSTFNQFAGSTVPVLAYGFGGDDLLRGGQAADFLFGGSGNDNLRANQGADFMDGGDGYDFCSYIFVPVDAANGIGATVDFSAITGTSSPTLVADGLGYIDTVVNIEKFGLSGTVFADSLSGSQIDDQIVGNLGNDSLRGNGGNDNYFYFANNASTVDNTIVLTDGFDTLINSDGDGSGFDVLAFVPAEAGEAGVSIDNVYAYRSDLDLVLSLQAGTGWDDPPAAAPVGAVTIQGFYSGNAGALIDRIEFGDAYATVTLTTDSSPSPNPLLKVEVFDLGDVLQQTLLAGVDHNNDTITGTAGNDLIDGGYGNDLIDGGDGEDTAYFTGASGDYSFTANADGSITVTDLREGSPDGTDTYLNVEFGRFSDGTFAAGDIFPNDLPPTGAPTGALLGATEDQSYTIYNADLVAGFTDPEGGALTAASLAVDHGTVTYNYDGTWTYVPDANFNGPVTLNYEVVDEAANGVDTSLQFAVAAVNDLPVAVADTGLSTPRYTPITFNVLANDSDVDIARGEAQTLSLTAVSTPGTGTVSFTAGGNITYTPPGNSFSGNVSFNYTVSDGAGGTATGSITVTVTSEVWGTPGNDSLTGSTANDFIYGLAGNDTIDGRGGKDIIDAGTGDDTLVVSGNDMLKNDPGAGDTINAGPGTDTIRLGGNASYDAGQQSFASMSVERLDLNGKVLTVLGTTTDLSGLTLVGTSGSVQGDAGNNLIMGTSGNDTIDGLGGADTLSGGAGNDILTGGAGTDAVDGGDGNDIFRVGGSELDGDRYWGGAGTDTLQFTSNVTLSSATMTPSTLIGVEILDMAKKTLFVNTSAIDLSSIGSVANGGDIQGDANANYIKGTGGNDTIKGGAGADRLLGDAGDDAIYGGAGSDNIRGGLGNDSLYGSDSKSVGDGIGDAFVFDTQLNASSNIDTIYAFEAGGNGLSGGAAGDKIYLDGTIFNSFGLYLDANEFVMNNGGNAVDSFSRILYDTKTGTLYYDPDGLGGVAKIPFAILDKTITGTLDATDFQVGTP